MAPCCNAYILDGYFRLLLFAYSLLSLYFDHLIKKKQRIFRKLLAAVLINTGHGLFVDISEIFSEASVKFTVRTGAGNFQQYIGG